MGLDVLARDLLFESFTGLECLASSRAMILFASILIFDIVKLS